MAKQVLVTGAAGFIPSHLVDALLNAGHTVLGVDNFVTGSADNLKQASQSKNFTFIEADVTTDPNTYLPTGYKPDWVFHMASPASPVHYQADPVNTYSVNAFGCHYLLSYLREYAPEARFLFASTSEVYGDPLVHPQSETYWGNVNPNGVRSCYDESKRMGETICGVFFRDFQIDVRIIRIFNTYGPRMDLLDGRVIPNFVMQALHHEPYTLYGDGSQTRSYCFVDDLVAALLLFIRNDSAAGQTINLGNPEEFTVKETAEAVHQVLFGTDAPIEFEYKPLPGDDPTRRKPDLTKAKKLLGWQPTVPFISGINKTIEDFKTRLKQS